MSEVGAAYEEVQLALGAEAAQLMRFTCTLSTPGAPTNNGDGTFEPGEPTTISDVPCDVEPLSSYERMAGGAVTAGADYEIEFPVVHAGAQLFVPASATVVVNATSLIASVSFEVVGPLPSKSIWKQRVAATLRG